MTPLLVVVLVGAGTYFSRSVFIVALAQRTLPEGFERAMRNVGPAVLAALVAALLVGSDGVSALAPSPETGALVVAGLVAMWRKNVMLVLAVGMMTFWILGALFS